MLKALYSALTLMVLQFSSLALAQAATDGPVQTPGAVAGQQGAPGWSNLLLLGGMIFFMWFFVIRPQAKRQKEHKTFLDSLQSGMEVVTASGLIGRIVNVTDSIVTVDLGNSSVRVLKNAISGKLDSKTLETVAAQK